MKTIDCRELPPSKSLMLRALVVRSFFRDFKIEASIVGDDVECFEKAIGNLPQKEFFVGAGAAPLRFLALRLTREHGDFVIRGTPRLFERPMNSLLKIFEQMKVTYRLEKDCLHIHSSGEWPESIEVEVSESSQILSGLLLSCWGLKHPLTLKLVGKAVSDSYSRMTLQLLVEWGMKCDRTETQIKIPSGQTLQCKTYKPEMDMGSLFPLAAISLFKEGTLYTHVPNSSLQGDFYFIKILQTMGAQIDFQNDKLQIARSELRAAQIDLGSTPDLFPVVASLCAFATGKSCLLGLGHLNSKESRRLDRMTELLRNLGAKVSSSKDEINVEGPLYKFRKIAFDPDQDHRLAMAAAILQQAGAQIEISNSDVVAKSFPDFWNFVARL